MILDRREAMAGALATITELNGNAHPYPPDALAPPVGYVDGVTITRDGSRLKSLSLSAELVIVADGASTEALKLLDVAAAKAWTALIRASCTPESMTDERVSDGTNVSYPAIRLTVTTATACTP